jgi:hypothetical protein
LWDVLVQVSADLEDMAVINSPQGDMKTH